MDIERMKKLLSSGIEAENKVKAVREVIRLLKHKNRICMMIQQKY